MKKTIIIIISCLCTTAFSQDYRKFDKQGMLKDQIAMMKAQMKKGPVQQMRRY